MKEPIKKINKNKFKKGIINKIKNGIIEKQYAKNIVLNKVKCFFSEPLPPRIFEKT